MSKGSFIDKMSAIAAKIGGQRHLSAIRDGFVTIMPLMIVGSLVTLINNIPIGTGANGGNAYLKQWLGNISWLKWITELNGNVWWGTFGMISILALIAIAYHLAKSYKADKLSAAVVALSTFLCAVPQMATFNADGKVVSGWGFIPYTYTNAMGLFVAIIIALVSTEIFVRLSRAKFLVIKMPEGVPPAVSRSFAALLPAMLTVLIVTLITVLIADASKSNVFDIISTSIVKPFSKASGTLAFGSVIVFLTHVLWMFGIHGPNIFEGLLQPLNVLAIQTNTDLLASGAHTGFIIFNKSFLDAFIYMGGAGTGLGLVIALFMASKSKQNRMVGQISAAPGLFNINEPVLFGLPIVLNPIFVVPFILTPLVLLVVSYVATAIGLVPVVHNIIPWTTPPIFSGILATGSWTGAVLQVINLAIAIAIYIPFVKIADKVEAKKEQALLAEKE